MRYYSSGGPPPRADNQEEETDGECSRHYYGCWICGVFLLLPEASSSCWCSSSGAPNTTPVTAAFPAVHRAQRCRPNGTFYPPAELEALHRPSHACRGRPDPAPRLRLF